MGCLFRFILLCLIIVGIVCVVGIGLICLPFIAAIGLVISIFNYRKVRTLQPSSMTCPNCNNNNLRIETLKTETTYSSKASGSTYKNFIGGHNWNSGREGKRKYNYKHEAHCSNCGYTFDFINADEVNSIKSSAKKSLIIFAVLLAISIPIFIGAVNQTEASIAEEQGSIWALEQTPIEEFDYYLDGDTVFLTKYIGNSKRIRIGNQYEIEGKTYNLSDTLNISLRSCKSVIIPEGIKHINQNIFINTGVKNLYLPMSLEADNETSKFYHALHDVEKIYYGGSEEEWHILTQNVERDKIDATEIIYNTDVSTLA